MLCKCHWIVLYTVHFTAFCLGGPFFPGHGVIHLLVTTAIFEVNQSRPHTLQFLAKKLIRRWTLKFLVQNSSSTECPSLHQIISIN